ncbi:MAG: Flp pilus assembly protein CpaB [Candidatus Schekmanbacteria bacterium]|nr:Flp pilus assembly protein CpaB [Candidatus Schekmanbacteria bacterium]
MQKSAVFIATGIALGIAAAAGTHFYLKQERAAVWKDAELVEAVVAAHDIRADSLLQPSAFTTDKIPQKGLHPNTVRPNDINFDKLTGVKLNVAMKKGQPLLWTDFSSGVEIQRLSEIIRKGERAISIPVSPVSSVNNFIRPNDHVDIIGTFKIEYPNIRADAPPPSPTFTTLTILQNVTILAVGSDTEYSGRIGKGRPDAGSYTAITVEVTEEEAQQLVFAQNKGTLTFVLRNNQDVETYAGTPKTTVETLFKDEFRDYLQQKRNRRVEIIRGGN